MPCSTASSASNGGTSSPAANSSTLMRPPLSAPIWSASHCALVPTPGAFLGQVVTMRQRSWFCAIAGAAKLAPAAAAALSMLRRSMACSPFLRAGRGARGRGLTG